MIVNHFVDTLYENKVNINNLNHLDLLTKLNIPKNQMILCGSALLVVYNIIPKNNDLDIIVSKQVKDKLLRKYKDIIQYDPQNKMYEVFDGKIEFSDKFNVLNLDFNEIMQDAINISGYNFMSIKNMIRFYKHLNRPKDQEKIHLIKKYL